MIGHVLQFLDVGDSALDAVHPVFVQWRVALASEHVLTIVFFNGLFEKLLGLVSRGRHQRVVVVERDHRQNDVAGERVAGANERLGAAGALEPV